jgi:hypothetical protein
VHSDQDVPVLAAELYDFLCRGHTVNTEQRVHAVHLKIGAYLHISIETRHPLWELSFSNGGAVQFWMVLTKDMVKSLADSCAVRHLSYVFPDREPAKFSF